MDTAKASVLSWLLSRRAPLRALGGVARAAEDRGVLQIGLSALGVGVHMVDGEVIPIQHGIAFATAV